MSEVLRVSRFPHIHTWFLSFNWPLPLSGTEVRQATSGGEGGGCLPFPAREFIRQEGRGYVREASELTDDRIQLTESNWKGEVRASHSAASRGPSQWSSG